ncbi:MAG TPA: hypothetical protein VII93_02590, partial [Anaerolineales bacterium]
LFGVEVRPIPQDDITALGQELDAYCEQQGLEFKLSVNENGIRCDADNPHLASLLTAAREVSGQEPRLGRKLPATSARFAPSGQGLVWGQTGIGPHARDERHFIPSILPYYRILQVWGDRLVEARPG